VRRADGLEDLDAVALRLLGHAFGQFGAADAVGETGVVVEALGDAGLATRRGLLDDQHLGVLARAVDRRRQSRRSAADDDEVVLLLRGDAREPDSIGQLVVRRFGEERAVGKDDRRDDALAVVARFDLGGLLGELFEVDPLVGHAV
jgi:hypothetical protein